MNRHIPIVSKDLIDSISTIVKDKVVLDCTYGIGGHTHLLLQLGAKKIVAIDYDKANFDTYPIKDSRVECIHFNFAHIDELVKTLGYKFDVIIADFGVHDNQIFDDQYGLSYNKNFQLTMRVNNLETTHVNARYIVNNWSVNKLADLFKTIGEDSNSYIIAKRICEVRRQHKITTTGQLVNIIDETLPMVHKRTGIYARIFQSLRIYVNEEIQNIAKLLKAIPSCLNEGGYCVFVTFHSIEDRIIKNFLLNREIFHRCEQLRKFLELNNMLIGKCIKNSSKHINRGKELLKRKNMVFIIRKGQYVGTTDL